MKIVRLRTGKRIKFQFHPGFWIIAFYAIPDCFNLAYWIIRVHYLPCLYFEFAIDFSKPVDKELIKGELKAYSEGSKRFIEPDKDIRNTPATLPKTEWIE